MGFGQVFTTLTFLMVFAGMVVAVTGMQKTIGEATAEIKRQQAQLAEQQDQEITITNTAYGEDELRDWLVTYNDEFDQGNHTNTTSTTDQTELATGETRGEYTSAAHDTGHASNYTTISWSAVTPGGSTLSFQVRSADTLSNLESASFIGPDGTTGTSYTTSGTTLNDTHDGDQLIQYRATLTDGGSGTPELQDTTIRVRRLVGHATLTIENTGTTKLDFDETDAYVDGVRADRTSADRHLEQSRADNERLWDPGEELNITVFTNITTSKTITIANEYAKDQATVTP